MWPLLLRPVKLLDIVVIFPLHEKEKRKCLGVRLSFRVSMKLQVHLPVPENALWSMTPVLFLPRHLSLLEEKDEKLDEIEELRQFSKEECRNCYCLLGLW